MSEKQSSHPLEILLSAPKRASSFLHPALLLPRLPSLSLPSVQTYRPLGLTNSQPLPLIFRKAPPVEYKQNITRTSPHLIILPKCSRPVLVTSLTVLTNYLGKAASGRFILAHSASWWGRHGSESVRLSAQMNLESRGGYRHSALLVRLQGPSPPNGATHTNGMCVWGGNRYHNQAD